MSSLLIKLTRTFTCFLLLVFASCGQKASENKQHQDSTSHREQVSDEPYMFGGWTMCATSNDSTMFQMNVCPTFYFDSSGTGYENHPGLFSDFKWTLKNHQLKIYYEHKPSNKWFPDTIYYTSFRKEGNSIDLIITDKQCNFYLSRSIPDQAK